MTVKINNLNTELYCMIKQLGILYYFIIQLLREICFVEQVIFFSQREWSKILTPLFFNASPCVGNGTEPFSKMFWEGS
jgi:hypothetical protein